MSDLEPNVHEINVALAESGCRTFTADQQFQLSIAISLKRIADVLEGVSVDHINILINSKLGL